MPLRDLSIEELRLRLLKEGRNVHQELLNAERKITWLENVVLNYVGTDAAIVDPAGFCALSEPSK